MELVNRIRGRAARFTLMVALASIAAPGLAACDSEPGATPTPTAEPTVQATATTAQPAANGDGTGDQIKADLNEWKIDLDKTEASAGDITFAVSNDGQFPHDLVVLQGDNKVSGTRVFNNADGTQTLQVSLQPGTYKLVCDIPSHADRGMTTQFTVK